jgi:hypothetical protein
MISVVPILGDNLQPELPACLPIFLERLKNEITRLTAVKVSTKRIKLSEQQNPKRKIRNKQTPFDRP